MNKGWKEFKDTDVDYDYFDQEELFDVFDFAQEFTEETVLPATEVDEWATDRVNDIDITLEDITAYGEDKADDVERFSDKNLEKGWDYDDVFDEFVGFFEEYDFDDGQDHYNEVKKEFDAVWTLLEKGEENGLLDYETDDIRDNYEIFRDEAKLAAGKVQGAIQEQLKNDKKEKDETHEAQLASASISDKDGRGMSDIKMISIAVIISVILSATVSFIMQSCQKKRLRRKTSNDPETQSESENERGRH